MLIIRNVTMNDLPDLVIIEHICFPIEEAATEAALKKRIQFIPDSFFVAEEGGVIVGLVNGPVIEREFITDDLFEEIKKNPAFGGHQTVLGVAVTPHFQTRGVATALLLHLEKEAKAKERESITLTCKEDLIRFYENLGYHNRGVSKSEHGGVTWYNMIKKLQ
ncbi:GNAT family N-acetyltransferase [Neobacillus sp. CF12]|uniref:GNAT family N-acetyltransferase n=1 Tax=Neobacillus sp. CF12 TaxID=3055864 RepID=UPI0025A0CD06|nr:GNAT family N-acetyltransferase [Neobacillus sp. CF12]MDM5326616.1 GNAT family N-acetyltransferase [Neobacillus sp. CF12]